LCNNHAGLDAWTDRNRESGEEGSFEDKSVGLCAQCKGTEGAAPILRTGPGFPAGGVWLHKECVRHWRDAHPHAAVERAKPASAANGSVGLCDHCRKDNGVPPKLHAGWGCPPDGILLHPGCANAWFQDHPVEPDPWADLDIPEYLDRRTKPPPRPGGIE
jgi:hypothetical protein